MASNQTPNLKLCQWEADDEVLRTDFNADNAKIDAAVAGKFGVDNLPWVMGTYIGTAMDEPLNASQSQSIYLGFRPTLLIIVGSNGASAIAMTKDGVSQGAGTSQDNNNFRFSSSAVTLTDDGFTVTRNYFWHQFSLAHGDASFMYFALR